MNAITEQQWLNSNAPKAMLQFMEDKASERKLRLFTCYCCRAILDTLSDVRGQRVIEIGELYADCLATDEDWTAARAIAEQLGEDSAIPMEAGVALTWTLVDPQKVMVWLGARICSHNARCLIRGRKFHAVQAGVLRDLFANPFQPLPSFDRRWLNWNNGMVRSMAATIYEERAFDHMPILADALEDAGCDNADILNHCRQPGVHVRGCWVVDLLLDKS